MCSNGFARLALASMFLAASCAGAAAQEGEPGRPAGACFEIIVPQPSMPPARPLLFNRCTGATWLLVGRYAGDGSGRRVRRLVYRWVSVDADQPSLAGRGEQVAPASPAAPAAAAPMASGRRCFEFTGRRFCE